MKTVFRLASFTLISIFLASCGSKENKSTTDPAEEVKDSTEILASEPEPEIVVEDITLTVVGDEMYCVGNDPIYLLIKGGKAFEDEAKPYKVEAKKHKEASISFGKFKKGDDGSFKVAMSFESFSNDENGVKMQILVTDADGTVKTMNYVIPYCP